MRQHSLYQKVNNKIDIRALLSGFIKKLFQKVEYLRIYISNLASLKSYHHLLEKRSRKNNNNLYPH